MGRRNGSLTGMKFSDVLQVVVKEIHQHLAPVCDLNAYMSYVFISYSHC